MIKAGDEPIPGYRVEALLGRGQFGEVWRARSPGSTKVALKFLELSGVHGWKEYRAIQRVKEIRHAHLMPIVALWLLDEEGQVLDEQAIQRIAQSRSVVETQTSAIDTLIAAPPPTDHPTRLIVATLVADGSLCDRMKACQAQGLRGIPVDELLNFMSEAAKGLDFLNSPQHKIGETVGAVQHCDVKPDNIMLSGGSVVIADFGVAQTLAQARLNATATSLGGTPAYMAPELFLNKPSKASDQYSLAVTYYELRTGDLPFREQTYAAVYQAHREGTLDFSGCKPAEREILKRATATKPENRYSSCGEFVEALRASLQPKAPADAPRRRQTSAGPALAALAIALVAGGLGLGLFWWLNHTPRPPLGRVVITVNPPDAQVTIDGQPATVSATGEVIAERPVGEQFVFRATRPPEWGAVEETLQSTAADQRREFDLPLSVTNLANEAYRLIADGAVPDEAVAALVKAIKVDPETYARLPDPIVGAAGVTAIEALMMAPSGARLAIASRDRAIHQWKIDGGTVAQRGSVVQRAAGEVLSLAATDDWIAWLSDPGSAIVLHGADGSSYDLRVPDASGEIKQIAITGDGRTLVAASEVMEVIIPPERKAWVLHKWRLDAADVAATYELVEQRENEFGPRIAAARRGSWVALATTDGARSFCRLCPLKPGQQSEPVFDQVGDLTQVVVSPDDRLVAVGGGGASGEGDRADYKATLVDVASKRFQSLRRGHQDLISQLAFDATGEFLATGDEEGNAQAWTIPTDWDGAGQPADEPVFLRDGTGAMTAMVCPRKNWVACCVGGRVALWDCEPGNPRSIELATPSAAVTALAATPDGRWLVTGHEDGSLRFWNLPRIVLVFKACAAAGVPMQMPSSGDSQA